jgi:hypothetical protein
MDPRLEAAGLPELCAQNWQNNLCEMDKWWRTRAGEGTPKQLFAPTWKSSGGLFAA